MVADGGDFVATASYIGVRPRRPLSWLGTGAFGTLGVGAGFALGAAIVRPGAEVWLLLGDGAAGYGLIEFDTFVRHGVPVISVVGNVTSVGLGKGGDLGGLAGADRHCAALAKAAGGPDRPWRAYLSTQTTGPLTDTNFVNARDRIGAGPWQNAKGVVIATNVDKLHSANNNITKETTL